MPRDLLARTTPGELPEMDHLESILDALSRWGRPEVLTELDYEGHVYPVYAVVVGDAPRDAPLLLVLGGVHGLERIGTKVVLAYMATIAERLSWDELTRDSLSRVRLAFVPLLNPVGMALRRRANGNGVDLMRNAPEEANGVTTPLVGGQRLSRWLPWYMGPAGQPMEAEASAFCDFVRREAFGSRAVVALDIHSGFGMVDRLWFPYARTKKPFPSIAETFALKKLLDRTLPHHIYKMEPQAQAYTIRGDVWDYLYDAYHAHQSGLFLPFTLEMGSWLWVKKNPAQALSALGSFNPVVPHRLRRTLRRHMLLLDFLLRAVASSASWTEVSPARRSALRREALELWYAGT